MKKYLSISMLCLLALTACQRSDSDAKRNESAMSEESEADRDISNRVRSLIKVDDSLSPKAAEIWILTKNGAVTLRGPVANEREKYAIGLKAKTVKGVRSVENQLEAMKR